VYGRPNIYSNAYFENDSSILQALLAQVKTAIATVSCVKSLNINYFSSAKSQKSLASLLTFYKVFVHGYLEI